ncbi:hypothetical protein T4D_7333 [Trichinella pseudospiralis]|uniref:Uncharacterized protein n=1 Tax=Trichinella pseudospiralis TaxID=6337 RepID=A0A0V1DS48_TRIPS|nr:hypothetical protein T4D_7333 [Trichinella pseudospiralis]
MALALRKQLQFCQRKPYYKNGTRQDKSKSWQLLAEIVRAICCGK